MRPVLLSLASRELEADASMLVSGRDVEISDQVQLLPFAALEGRRFALSGQQLYRTKGFAPLARLIVQTLHQPHFRRPVRAA